MSKVVKTITKNKVAEAKVSDTVEILELEKVYVIGDNFFTSLEAAEKSLQWEKFLDALLNQVYPLAHGYRPTDKDYARKSGFSAHTSTIKLAFEEVFLK